MQIEVGHGVRVARRVEVPECQSFDGMMKDKEKEKQPLLLTRDSLSLYT